ncbi:ACP phosphodiesterase [Photorhabdus laumondii subsp. laumondii]|uniref:Acyl carrier protein phosphodiesterase n=4 Tax=Photorhabdus TaxID=29487 RepID=ACPH_PHOLL|nr:MULTISPECIES: ACP phosphodiesterase [Photorhabdus]Q7N0I2.1 RecName: Full=Acyl carrier protein phosphodiesterase; Short=ACP phosphodiesterase [Photorhabdus laumondii subsp. laumondii TTO1]PQQ38260.1 ACP phosphodiesterase [Photorhabdus luminescens]AWK43509.1 ACP phosphodiesterase [Photorhabdus laumondii subsp. laumondii]AXG44187.1 ACP phosphodiesterase [Photorhabdus laumondii subsp. laumondii]AXG48815.1 ACP phosphodiesterase [Photorhabdus laumondii subsp. laumondii]KTL63395.1 ACP phosphodies
MNFLAHLHLATLADSSLLGNLMADFVRGNPEGQYSADVVAGIRMHRRVDVLTDTHPLVIQARHLFSNSYRRVAPITLDIIWDHFLSLNWDKLVPTYSLPAFIHHARSQIEPHLYYTPEKFQELNAFLWRQNWLIRYADLAFIADVLKGMARRHPRLSALSGSFQDIEQHYADFDALFWQFYPYMMEKAENKDFYCLPQ